MKRTRLALTVAWDILIVVGILRLVSSTMLHGFNSEPIPLFDAAVLSWFTMTWMIVFVIKECKA